MKQELPSAGTVTGIYQATGRGFGFVTPENAPPRAADLFIPPAAGGGAWNGDKVTVLPDVTRAAEGERRTARVISVLERNNRIVTGAICKRSHQTWLQPDDDRLPGPIQVVGKGRSAHAGDKAAVAMAGFGSDKRPPLGTLRAVFGRDGSRQAAAAAVLYHYEINPEFPPAVLEQAAQIPEQVEQAALDGRLDLRERLMITIDGASAKDLDDAVSLERDEQGRWVLGVHIADVSHYVKTGSPLDLEAWERGTSVYFADQVIPMLPPELSNGICSLNPQVDRLTLSCLMTLGADGQVLEHRIAKSVIRTAERMTYADCNVLLDARAPAEQPGLAQRYAHVLPMLREMAALAQVLERRRRTRGSLDLESSECCILCDESGAPVEVCTRRQGVSEKLIESFMLAANECVAEHLNRLDKPAIYRVHEKPSQEKRQALRAVLDPMGYQLPQADNFALQKVLSQARGRPESAAVSAAVLRALMKARYEAVNLGHFGLAAEFYCHFTSPIRRYPDLMVHRILTALLEGRLTGTAEKRLSTAAKRAAVQSSQRELAAQSAEREIEKLYLAEFMSGHIGETFRAAVSGVTRFGVFVMTAGGVEGLLPMEALPDDAYRYDESRMRIVGERTGAVFTSGTPLEVVCVAADPGSGQVDFRLAGEAAGGMSVGRREKQQRALPRQSGAGRRAMHVPKGRKGRKRQ